MALWAQLCLINIWIQETTNTYERFTELCNVNPSILSETPFLQDLVQQEVLMRETETPLQLELRHA